MEEYLLDFSVGFDRLGGCETGRPGDGCGCQRHGEAEMMMLVKTLIMRMMTGAALHLRAHIDFENGSWSLHQV